MARQRKPEEEHHTFRMTERDSEFLLVGKGRNAYLWTGPIGTSDGTRTFSGPVALRALAFAILNNIPETRK